MAASREDIYRSALAALTEAPSMAGVTILIQQLVQSTLRLSEWVEFSLTGLQPDPGKTDHLIEHGAIRVLCRWREQPSSDSGAEISRVWAIADNVVAALRWKDILVRDFASGGTGAGLNIVGLLACRESSIEDQGDALDGVKSLACVVEFVFSGAA